MSNAAVAWALRASKSGKMDASHRLVLLVLADHAHEDGSAAWPSQDRIARILGITTRSVRRSLSWLEANQRISRGDQKIVGHLPADKRPVVWDLPTHEEVELSTAPARDRTVSSPRTRATGRSRPERPDGLVRSDRTVSSDKPRTEHTTELTPQTPRSLAECPHGQLGGLEPLARTAEPSCPLCRLGTRRGESQKESA